jgi:hypothetical protein
MATLLLLAVALAQPPAPSREPPLLICSLVTPAGETVGFMAPSWDESSDDIMLVGTEGSVWPTRTLPGQRGIMTGTPRAPRMFAFGAGNGLALDIGDSSRDHSLKEARLYRRNGEKVGLSVAFGFCRLQPAASVIFRALDPAADPREIGANIPAFDPARWPGTTCGLILSDGRRVPFQFSLAGQDRVTLSSPELWAGRPITMDIRWGTVEGDQAGTFSRRGGPEGFQVMSVLDSSAARLIWLRQIGGSAQSGFGICGYPQVVRRPSP